jgi:DNA-binding NtrC family response regulator
MDKQSIILVVDNQKSHADGVVESLDGLPVKAIAVYTARDALNILHIENVDCVLTELNLDDEIDGLKLLEEAKKINPVTEVIILTANPSIDTCKDTIRHGAFDYLVKPVETEKLRSIAIQACRKVQTARLRSQTVRTDMQDFLFEGVKGKSRKMQGIFQILQRIAQTNLPVLIEGESGTGKELLARAIHDNSPRSGNLFRPVNCAGITETLLESELFGHVRGAFTGAAADRKGLFETADKGTLFLDEIGDMAQNSQAKLLRVLEDGIVIPVGSNKPIKVDVRVISASNQDLARLIEEKKFRQDLYFRIKGIGVVLPPLRERVDDIPAFVEFFIKEAAAETGSKVTGITDAALNILKNYDWPGNIRQLKNCIRTMVVMTNSDKLDVADIPPEVSKLRQLPSSVKPADSFSGLTLQELEKQAIIETLAKTGNNRQLTAKILGIGERTLYRKIKEYKLG